MEYLVIIFSTVFANNIVLTRFLGICPFIGVSNKTSSALGMSIAVIFVMTLATVVTFLIDQMVLDPLGLGYLRTVVYILVIAALVQIVEIILKKISPALYQALGVFLPLITTNCTILGVALLVIQNDMSLAHSLVYAVGNGVGFALALILFSNIRERLEIVGIPQVLKGVPIALITAGLLSMAFMGFVGFVK